MRKLWLTTFTALDLRCWFRHDECRGRSGFHGNVRSPRTRATIDVFDLAVVQKFLDADRGSAANGRASERAGLGNAPPNQIPGVRHF